MHCTIAQSNDLQTAFEARLAAWVDTAVNTEGCSLYREILRLHFNAGEFFCPDAIKNAVRLIY